MIYPNRPLTGPQRGPVVACAVAAAGVLVVAVWGAHHRWYVAGCCLLGLTLVLLARRAFPRLAWSTTARRGLTTLAAVAVGAVAALVPTAVVRTTDGGRLWAADSGDALEFVRLGDRLYTHSPGEDQARDPDTGRVLASVPDDGSLAVTDDGGLITWDDDEASAYGRDGRRHWTMTDEGHARPIAAHGGWTIVEECTTSGHRTDAGCAVAPDGTTTPLGLRHATWPFGAETIAEPSEAAAEGYGIVPLPTVAVATLTHHRTAIYAATGRRIGTVAGTRLGVAGDLVLVARGSCDLVAYRGGRARWQATVPACRSLVDKDDDVLLQRHIFVETPAATYAIHLADGSMRSYPKLAYDRLTGTIPGDDVVITRDHDRLTGLDPETGKTLWSYRAYDDRADVEIANGAVVLYGSDPGSRRWLLRLSGRRSDTSMLTEVLDARTGKVTARLASGELWSSPGIGRGRAIVVGRTRMTVIGH